ncbi:hypothetical protein [Winogradskya consettensis]|uniref:hypothetical protein n=1 Tax=Winogradskya consettensis TaxID=113560 RepID=UPI001BB333C1|nr:hypothetical protein [Actinoplanes consettensis]
MTGVDVGGRLVGWANLMHHQRNVTTAAFPVADGMGGFPRNAPYDRIVGWCTPPELPRARIEQLAVGGLDLLVEPAHTEVCRHAPLDRRSWTAGCSALGDPQLSTASLRDGTRAAGHGTTTSAAMAGSDGVIVADGPGPPSLSVLRGRLRDWERAGRSGADGYRGVWGAAAAAVPAMRVGGSWGRDGGSLAWVR